MQQIDEALLDGDWETYCSRLTQESQQRVAEYLRSVRDYAKKNPPPPGGKPFPKGEINCATTMNFYSSASAPVSQAIVSSSTIESVEEDGKKAVITRNYDGRNFETEMFFENGEWKMKEKAYGGEATEFSGAEFEK